MEYDDSSDSDVEVLGDCSNHHGKPCHSRASQATKNYNRKKITNRSSLRLKENQHDRLTPSASTSIYVEAHEHTPSDSSEEESDGSTIIQPTPCSKTTRSILTKRRHRSPIATFDHSEDSKGPMLSRSQAQSKISGLPNCRGKAAVTDTDTPMPHRSSLQIESSPLIKNRKQKWKRIASLNSDSD